MQLAQQFTLHARIERLTGWKTIETDGEFEEMEWA